MKLKASKEGSEVCTEHLEHSVSELLICGFDFFTPVAHLGILLNLLGSALHVNWAEFAPRGGA